jgi:hypothetical protein
MLIRRLSFGVVRDAAAPVWIVIFSLYFIPNCHSPLQYLIVISILCLMNDAFAYLSQSVAVLEAVRA